MDRTLRQLQEQAGATFEEDSTIPASFGNDSDAIAAATTRVVLCDRSHWGLLELTESDRTRFLHNQTTNDIQSLKPGQGCDTVIVTSTARTIDLATIYITQESILALVSPGQVPRLIEWFDGYLFPMDRVTLKDVSDKFAIFNLIGPGSDAILQQWGNGAIASQPNRSHQLVQLDDVEIRIAVGSGLALPGYTLIVPLDNAAKVWSKILEAEAMPLGDRAWEQLRIRQGRPKCDRELTDTYNPLEAGLWDYISFDKGCYIGQETIARLNTYKGVKQRLWGIRLSVPVAPETEITADGSKVGILTSVVETPEGTLGLGYVRAKAGGEGLTVKVGEAEGEIIAVPFLSHP
ncbi:MAG: folate-binding protein [Cyanobacteriota bacterium]|nr:folate-binding protein [Cyanobacteriota bacterium]